MEPKKNPKYDIHRSRSIIFNIGLAISLLLVITAFNWSVETDNRTVCKGTRVSQRTELAVIPIVYEKKKEVLSPKRHTTEEPKVSLESINIKAVSDAETVDEVPPGVVDQNNSPMIEFTTGSVEIPVESTSTEFRFVEKMPEPVDGWQAFFQTLQKHIKYPRRAQRDNVAGKVYVEFTVNEKGGLDNFSILKGIGSGCDEEALRVLALTKWRPGKQRGRPVKVRLVQPVTFSLGLP